MELQKIHARVALALAGFNIPQFRFEALNLRVDLFEILNVSFQTPVMIHEREQKILSSQLKKLVLARDLHKIAQHLLKLFACGRKPLNPDAVLGNIARRKFASHQQQRPFFGIDFKTQALEALELLGRLTQIKNTLHLGVGAAGAHEVAFGFGSQQERDGIKEQALARSRLTGKRRHPSGKLEFSVFYDREVFDSKFDEHDSPLIPVHVRNRVCYEAL